MNPCSPRRSSSRAQGRQPARGAAHWRCSAVLPVRLVNISSCPCHAFAHGWASNSALIRLTIHSYVAVRKASGVPRHDDAALDPKLRHGGVRPMNTSINKNEFAFKLPEMLSYHSTWDDADYEPVLPRRQAGWVSQLVAAPLRIVTRMAQRHRVMNELGAPVGSGICPISASAAATSRGCSIRSSRPSMPTAGSDLLTAGLWRGALPYGRALFRLSTNVGRKSTAHSAARDGGMRFAFPPY